MKRYTTDIEKDQKGGVRPKIKPVHVSNVALIDPESG